MLRLRHRAAVSSTTGLPGYADLTEIGSGAIATVYRATEIETGRNVALKIVKAGPARPNRIQTFHDEVIAFAKVSDHPNIVTLYRSLITPDGQPVLVLELCRESLAERLRRCGPLEAAEAVRVGIKIAGALEMAHRHGLLHRGLQPQEILVTQFDEPALADFGAAAWPASTPGEVGPLELTTAHVAPEILEGRRLSPATDVYGLASTMYHLVAGEAPFAAYDDEPTAAVILRILRDPVEPLESDSVPLELSDLLEAALAKEPGRRPQSAAEFAKALTTVEAACWSPDIFLPDGEESSAVGTSLRSRPAFRDPPNRPTPLLPPLLPSVSSDTLAPPSAGRAPSVRTPGRSPRNVVAPGGTTRGQPSGRLDLGPRRLPPLLVADDMARGASEHEANRPRFVDPDGRASVSPPGALGPRRGPGGHGAPEGANVGGRANRPTDRSTRSGHALAMAGVACALVVVVAALLLVVGAL